MENNKVESTSGKLGSSDYYLNHLSHNAGEKIGKAASRLSESAGHYLQNSRDYVKENPIKGAGIALAAGAVAGSLITMLVRKK